MSERHSTAQALNLDRLAQARLHEEPSPWSCYDGVFQPHVLTAPFPDDGFEGHAQRKLLEALGKKGSDAWHQHNVVTRPLLELGQTRPHAPERLDDVWLQVAGDLVAPAYRECITEAVGYDVRGLPLQAHFWRFGPGSFFQPHVDKQHKVVTHLMYLSTHWTPADGGCLRILGSGDPADIHVEIPPTMNLGVLLKRVDHAWHSVSLIPRESQRVRLVLQVWFWEG